MIARCCAAAVLVVGVAAVGAVGVRDAGAAAAAPTACHGSSALTTREAGYRAPATAGEVWALAFGALPAARGSELKVVWRVTGRGPLRVVFRDPDGDRHPLAFGPDRHRASSFRRPGAEWGTGFAFDGPGCWTVRVQRRGADATVGVRVV